jgi:hypothetical protein
VTDRPTSRKNPASPGQRGGKPVENHRENGQSAAGRVSGAAFAVGRGLWGCGIASDPESPVVSGQQSVLKKPATGG